MSLLGLKQISSLLILIKPNGHPTSKKCFILTKLPELFIDGITLERETLTKFLDVSIDDNFTWKAHINTVSIRFLKA